MPRPLGSRRLPEIRAVEADVVRALQAGRVEVVQALAAPRVVRLPRVHRHLDQNRCPALGIRAYDERHRPARAIRQRDETHEVVATHPVLRDLDGVRDRPGCADRARCRVCDGRVVDLTGAVLEACGQTPDEPRPRARVPAQAEDLDPVAPAARDVKVQRFAGADARLGGVARGRCVTPASLTPAGGAGERVLLLDGVLRGARPRRPNPNRLGRRPPRQTHERGSDDDDGRQGHSGRETPGHGAPFLPAVSSLRMRLVVPWRRASPRRSPPRLDKSRGCLRRRAELGGVARRSRRSPADREARRSGSGWAESLPSFPEHM